MYIYLFYIMSYSAYYILHIIYYIFSLNMYFSLYLYGSFFCLEYSNNHRSARIYYSTIDTTLLLDKYALYFAFLGCFL